MAGSYNHVVVSESDSKRRRYEDVPPGSLMEPDDICGMLECMSGDVVEAVEEMYGMIWWLAHNFAFETGFRADDAELVEAARTQYKEGLKLSPTPRFKEAPSNG